MSFKLKINTADSSLVGYSASALFHVAILVLVLILLNLSDDKSRINPPFVQVTTQDFDAGNQVTGQYSRPGRFHRRKK